MRKLVLLRGAPGSGKSTFAQQMGWEYHTLSMDQLRLNRRAPELSSDGRLQISQDENPAVAKEFFHLIGNKMGRGEFVVVDTQLAHRPKDILKLAEDHNYKVCVVDFSSMPIEQVRIQNSGRPEVKRVSEKIIEDFYKKEPANWDVPVFMWGKDQNHAANVKTWASEQLHDFSKYKAIHHIGDLQGCLSVLIGPGGILEHGIKDDELYIFVGDLLDRGIENGKVLSWFLKNAVPRDNVMLVWGNHEDHIWRWGRGLPAVSDEFEKRTLPQLLAEGLTPEDGLKVCRKAVELVLYTFNGQKVMVTHAGLPTVPVAPELVSSRQYSKGTGFWSDPIDEQFERNAPSDWVQVHGHRNHNWQEIQATPRSFNLENQVEFGGRLRWASLDQNGWTTGSNKNEVYMISDNEKEKTIQWKDQGMLLSAQTAQAMREHEGVKENVMAKQPHISSFNFTKDVFFNKSWDDVVVKARGFFVNTTTHEIVSRGYDKFFNINERPETTLASLRTTLQFPLIGYVKENGYLGNIGYDAQTQSLFVATKSSSSGDFSEWFKEILDNQMTLVQQEGLARWLRDNEACMTFEVIDPVRDPHMVEYAQPQLVLLDVFHRSEHTQRAEYEQLKNIAKKFGFEPKARGIVLRDADAFENWYTKVSQDINYRYHNKDIEGFVFEDTQGNMTKIKMANYAFWKRMRGQKERMAREWVKIIKAGEERDRKLDKEPQSQAPRFNVQAAQNLFQQKWKEIGSKIHPGAEAFLEWCAAQPETQWNKSIIQLREDFMKTTPDPALWSVPYSQDPEEQNKILAQRSKGPGL